MNLEVGGSGHRHAVIFLGPPGAGKGTQAKEVAQKYRLAHLSTGDMFRENVSQGTELGRRAKPIMDRGELVPDEIVLGMVQDRILRPDCARGFVLDGFPRTLPQAEKLGQILQAGGFSALVVILFVLDRSVLIRRLTGRRMCPVCGRIYHVYDRPPRMPGLCDDDGGTLVQRQDDTEAVIALRLDAYDRQTLPLVEYYRSRGVLETVDAGGEVQSVTRAVIEILDSHEDSAQG